MKISKNKSVKKGKGKNRRNKKFCANLTLKDVDISDTPELFEQLNDIHGERNNISEIIENQIYLGNYHGLNCPKQLEKNNINVIINFGDPVPSEKKSDKIEYLYYPIRDDGNENISGYFEDFFRIMEGLKMEGKNVFVCCVGGVSRSPSMVISYLMKKTKKGFNSTFDFVKSKRDIISPNLGFIFQLKAYEEVLFGKKNASTIVNKRLKASSPFNDFNFFL